MRTNHADQIVVDEDDFVDILYQGQDVNHVVVTDSKWIEQYQHLCEFFELPVNVSWEIETQLEKEDYINQCLADWNLSQEYQTFDIESFVLSLCSTQEQRDRVRMEMHEFEKRNMILVLRWLKYFVDVMNEHNMIIGVGRGSSVASYVLFLLGVHKVDSLAYDLDIKEFLK